MQHNLGHQLSGPDLVVANIYMKKYDPQKPLNCDRGPNTFVAVIKNIGDQNAAAFSTELRVETQPTGQVQTFTQAAPGGLAAKNEASIEFPTLTLGDGPHYLRATVDSGKQVAELDDAKNSREAGCMLPGP
jgi:subtilase family serine protease